MRQSSVSGKPAASGRVGQSGGRVRQVGGRVERPGKSVGQAGRHQHTVRVSISDENHFAGRIRFSPAPNIQPRNLNLDTDEIVGIERANTFRRIYMKWSWLTAFPRQI